MAEQKLGEILDGLGVTLDLEEADLISDALVLIKTIDPDGRISLGVACSTNISWIEQIGMVHAAIGILSGDGFEDRP